MVSSFFYGDSRIHILYATVCRRSRYKINVKILLESNGIHTPVLPVGRISVSVSSDLICRDIRYQTKRGPLYLITYNFNKNTCHKHSKQYNAIKRLAQAVKEDV